MGTAPSKENPFIKAADFLRSRARASMENLEGRQVWLQDEELAAAIARAWLLLPGDLRRKGWPAWT